MIKQRIAPKKILGGLRQVSYTFSQTAKLVWSANPRLLFAAFTVNIFSGIIIFPSLYLEKLTIDYLIKNVGNPFWREAIKMMVLLFSLRVVLVVLQSGLSRFSRFFAYTIGRVFSFHMDNLLGKKMAELDMKTLEDPEFLDRYNKVEREAGRRSWGLAMPLLNIPNFAISLASSLAILIFFRAEVALIICLLSIPEMLVDAKFTKLEYELETSKAGKYRVWGWISYLLLRARNFMEGKILNISPYLLKKTAEIQKEITNQTVRLRSRRETTHFLTYLPQNILVFFFSIYLGIMAITKKVTVGAAEMYIRAMYAFQGNLTGLVGAFLELYENYLFVTDVVWFLDLKPDLEWGKEAFPEKISSGIEFRDVWFRYKDNQPWILKGINMTINPKENIAIVGKNGVGKTTLIKLLCRFYDPQKGKIFVNGKEIKDYGKRELWDNLAVLFQNFEQYPFTARESIGYGRIEQVDNLDAISSYAKKSDIDDFITSLPLKYENPLAVDFEKGVNPSQGQWQKIGLARALIRNAAIVILDEPTSNVDPKSEEEIFRKIEKLASDKILFLISHRFSTVRKADRIFVMEKGKIIESGSHKELMKKKGLYHDLFELQAESYK